MDINVSLKTFYVICLAIKTINISCKSGSGGGGGSGDNEGGAWLWCGGDNKDNSDDNGGDSGGAIAMVLVL